MSVLHFLRAADNQSFHLSCIKTLADIAGITDRAFSGISMANGI